MSSPTQRSKALLEREGLLVATVERWNAFARIRQDLFGCIDLLAVGEGRTIACQTTTATNLSARRTKLRASPALPLMLSAGWIVELHSWAKVDRRWRCKREQLQQADFQ